MDLDGTFSFRSIVKAAAWGAAIGGAIACGVSIVCGVAVGVASGAAIYAAGTAGTKSFSWTGLASSAALGGVMQKVRIGGALGNKLANARGIGVISKRFGNNTFLSPSGYGKFAPGRWNNRQFFRVGWSGIRAQGGPRYVFRVGVGKKHLDLIYGKQIRYPRR